MNRRKWLWGAVLALPAALLGGLVYANARQAQNYTCPLTGEQLPCPNCCPLNSAKAAAAMEAKVEQPKVATDSDYICPITGEKLGCPNCCPLNKQH